MLRKIRVYGKLVVLVAMALVVGTMVLKNRRHTVTVWFFREYAEVNVLWLMLWTAVGSVLAWWLVWRVRGLWNELKGLHQESVRRQADEEQARRAQALREQEERIDDKIRQSLGDTK